MLSNLSGSVPDKMSVEVRDNPDGARYEVRANGKLAGFAQYHLHDGHLTFLHTEIEPEYEGGGIGSELARFALKDARTRRLAVVPLCPFIAGFIRRHPDDYLDLVVPEVRKRVMQDD